MFGTPQREAPGDRGDLDGGYCGVLGGGAAGCDQHITLLQKGNYFPQKSPEQVPACAGVLWSVV